jgi:quinoprotein glucose dehydrogenase
MRLPLLFLVLASVVAAQPTFDGQRYSTLKQIDRENVKQLQLAWKYDTGDAFEGSEMQCQPLVVDGMLIATTPKLRLIALDAATGKLIWRFDPHNGVEPKSRFRTRGLTYWSDGKGSGRVFVGVGPDLYAIDTKTGRPVASFGEDGRIDLREGLGRDPETLNVGSNSSGVIYKNLLILGSIVPEGLPSAPGDIRAFDVRTGKQMWGFHTIPHPGEFGYDTWPKEAWTYIGGANSWPGLTLDEKRGIVFAPTGSAAFDFYGSNRLGDNLFANCLIALDAATGKRLWHFQFVKHDVWDRDLPTAPTLATMKRDGKNIDVVIQTTKSGHVWVFDRETGKSMFPFREIDVPQSDVEGEVLAPKQVIPLKPEPFARQMLTEDMLTKRTPEAHKAALEKFRKVRNGPHFEPPSREGTIIFPGLDGGAEWGGGSWDPETGLFYVNANEMAWILRLIPRSPKGRLTASAIYKANCASCHREDMAGSPPEFPSLRDVANRRTREHIENVIRKGAGRMPGYAHLKDARISALVDYLVGARDVTVESVEPPSPNDLKYRLDGYVRFEDPDKYPVVTPPWGTLNALDLSKGEWAWRVPFGEVPALVEKGLRNTGSENYGGGIVTAGGLLFIGATNYDKKFRAFDKATGKVLWETTLEAAANATPVVYEVSGRQYVAIGAGGGKWGNPSGGTYYAFALPESKKAEPEK